MLLDCKKAGLPIKPAYSNVVLASFIEKVQKENLDSEVNIYFFGGEPTMEYSAIRELTQELRRTLSDNLSLKFVLHTNGENVILPLGCFSANSKVCCLADTWV